MNKLVFKHNALDTAIALGIVILIVTAVVVVAILGTCIAIAAYR